MVKKILFWVTFMLPLIIGALLLEGASWLRKWTHAYKDWVVRE